MWIQINQNNEQIRDRLREPGENWKFSVNIRLDFSVGFAALSAGRPTIKVISLES